MTFCKTKTEKIALQNVDYDYKSNNILGNTAYLIFGN